MKRRGRRRMIRKRQGLGKGEGLGTGDIIGKILVEGDQDKTNERDWEKNREKEND